MELRLGGGRGGGGDLSACSALMPVISCSRATKPRDISPACPCTPARASGIPMEPCGTRRSRRTMLVSGPGTPPPHPHPPIPAQSSCSHTQQLLWIVCLRLVLTGFTSHSLLSHSSGQVEEGQDCRLQWRDTRMHSQESRSPDSACYVSDDSRGSSPDWTLDGAFHIYRSLNTACTCSSTSV